MTASMLSLSSTSSTASFATAQGSLPGSTELLEREDTPNEFNFTSTSNTNDNSTNSTAETSELTSECPSPHSSVAPLSSSVTKKHPHRGHNDRHANNDSHSCPPQFVYLLHEYCDPAYSATHQYYHMPQGSFAHTPTLPELVCILKLFKAFAALKKSVLRQWHHNSPGSYSSDFVWKCFLARAAHRFTVFVSVLKAAFPDPKLSQPLQNNPYFVHKIDPSSPFATTLDKLVPPLDIVMIWYAFNCHLKNSYDDMARNNFSKFVFHPFPLSQIGKCIKNDDFSFHPSQSQRNNFTDFMKSFGYNIPFEDNTSLLECKVPIKCPNCYLELTQNLPLMAFVDPNFKLNIGNGNCPCGFSSILTHSSLRVRQLYADLQKDPTIPMPTLYKQIGLQHVTKDSHKVNPQHREKHHKGHRISTVIERADAHFKVLEFDPFDHKQSQSLPSLVFSFCDQMNNSSSPPLNVSSHIVLQQYLSYSLWHLTIPSNKRHKVYPLELSHDLVTMTLREESFISKINALDLLTSPHIEEALTTAISRYDQFIQLAHRSSTPAQPHNAAGSASIRLIPTLDIDLVWHTHQLSLYHYAASTSNAFSTPPVPLVDRNEPIDREDADKYYELTASAYRHMFRDLYTQCHCDFCHGVRSRTQKLHSKLFRISGKNKGDLIHDRNVGFSHISRYNALNHSDGLGSKSNSASMEKMSSRSSGGSKSPGSDSRRRSMSRRSTYASVAKLGGFESSNFNLSSPT